MEKEEPSIHNLFLVLSKQGWLQNDLIKWSEQEIDSADEKGFIGTKYRINCYLTRPIPAFNH